jgi:hypothetical protein
MNYILAFGLEELLLLLKALYTGKAIYSSSKSNGLLAFKAVCLKLKGLLLANRDAFDIALHPAKDTFRTTTRIFLVRHDILEITLLTPRTREHFKTSTLDSRYERVTLFALES